MGGSCFPEFLMTKQGYIVPIACLDLLLSQDFLKRENILLLSILEFLVPWTVFSCTKYLRNACVGFSSYLLSLLANATSLMCIVGLVYDLQILIGNGNLCEKERKEDVVTPVSH